MIFAERMVKVIKTIEKVLEEKVRPLLASHGGDVELESVSNNGVVKVRLLGSCSCCPSARITLEEVIKVQLISLDGINDVVLSDAVSEDMISFAKTLLGTKS